MKTQTSIDFCIILSSLLFLNFRTKSDKSLPSFQIPVKNQVIQLNYTDLLVFLPWNAGLPIKVKQGFKGIHSTRIVSC